VCSADLNGPALTSPVTHLAFELRTNTPAYAAHFRRTGIRPAQTSIAAEQLSDLPRLLEQWRDTVDEVVLVPVSASEAGPAGDLVDAAIASF
jgi:hypothetical protein